MPDVAITIVNTNHRDLLRACLRSIAQETRRHSYHIYVLDNASTDGSAAMVREESPQVTLVEQRELRGFSRNVNTLLRLSWGVAPYTLLFNEDAYLLDGALDQLLDFLQEHPQVAAVSPQLLYPDGSPQPASGAHITPIVSILRLLNAKQLLPSPRLRTWIGQRFPGLLPRFLRAYLQPYVSPNQTYEVNYGCAACLLIRREALENVGLLDEAFILSVDDDDWCRRAWARGWKVLYHGQARVVHHGGQSFGPFARVELERSQLHYLRKYCTPRFAILLVQAVGLVITLVGLVVHGGKYLLLRQPTDREEIRTLRRIARVILSPA